MNAVSSSASRGTVGFGCPSEPDPHHISVDIPSGRAGNVVITEQYGIRAGIDGLPDLVERCYLSRSAWSLISEDLKREFNERLRSKKLAASRWVPGTNPVERLLGKELLVLAWAVEKSDPQLIPNAIRNWIGLRPEERWWLFTMTAAATGNADQADVGLRKALRCALTENPVSDLIPVRAGVRGLRGRKNAVQLTLKDEFDTEPSLFLLDDHKEDGG